MFRQFSFGSRARGGFAGQIQAGEIERGLFAVANERIPHLEHQLTAFLSDLDDGVDEDCRHSLTQEHPIVGSHIHKSQDQLSYPGL